MAETTNKNVLFALYNDETELLSAVSAANKKHLEIWECFTPFPVHGLDDVMHIEQSRLHIAGFVYGLLGTMTAFFGMSWVFTRDWPIIFGGKPYWSVPAFIPITFELTVLFACVGMVITFYTICGLGPGVVNTTLHDRITDDKFCMAFDTTHSSQAEIDEINALFQETGASLVDTKMV